MALVGTGFMMPLCIIGSVFMFEAETANGQFPFFSIIQSLSALATVLFTAFPNFIWLTAAFRIEWATPELTHLLHDLGWIMWATPSWGFLFQLLSVAVVGLMDKRQQPFIPRWLSYFAIWVAIGTLPTPLVPFFTEGPFSWNGLFTFWIAFFSPIVWIALVAIIVFNHIRTPTSGDEHGAGTL